MTKEKGKWIGVAEYAKLIKKTRQQVYLDIRLKKIKKWRTVNVKKIQVNTEQ